MTSCSICNTDNAPGAKFCRGCGGALGVKCAACGADCSPGDNFCGACGARVAASSPRKSKPEPKPNGGERRRLTILFSDLIDSTAIAGRLDAEDWRDMASAYQRAAAEAIARFGGHVAKYLGDGVVAYFGWPQAHEDDAERATRAGLSIVDHVLALNRHWEQTSRPRLSVRVGIHTGPVVVGEGAGAATDVFGDAPNLAARVQAAADPDSVFITAATHRLVSGLFVVEDRGEHRFKGVHSATRVYRAVRPSGMRGRLDAAASQRGLTAFVGRADELRTLNRIWARCRAGAGQAVTIVGEPGIGKSRLVQQFHAEISGAPHTWIEGAASPFLASAPLYAVADMFKQLFRWTGEASPDQRIAVLEAALDLPRDETGEAVTLIAPLLGIPLPSRFAPLAAAPQSQHQRLLAILSAWVFRIARVQPLVIVAEDLHWMDPSTTELLGLLGERVASNSVLLLSTARPEFQPPWGPRAQSSILTLNRLRPGDIRHLIGSVTAAKPLPDSVMSAVVERAGGVPLFAEELTRAVVEAGGGALAANDIPETLHDSLVARLDRLGAAREIAQVAAAIGRQFSPRLLSLVAGVGEAELASGLAALVTADLVFAQGAGADAVYTFKHALVQDAAYESLLKSRRRELHLKIAKAISEHFPDVRDQQPELVARHFSEAGENELALAAWQRAAETAASHGALAEAERNYRYALFTLDALPADPSRLPQELLLAGALGQTIAATKGFTPELDKLRERVRHAAEKLNDPVQAATALMGGIAVAITRCEFRQAQTLADQFLELSDRSSESSLLRYALTCQGMTHYHRGLLAKADEFLKRAIAIKGEPLPLLYDFEVMSHAYAGCTAYELGRPETASKCVDKALALAKERNNPLSMGLAYFFSQLVHVWRGDSERVLDLSSEMIAFAAERALETSRRAGQRFRGWALARLGRGAEGMAEMQAGLGRMSSSTRLNMGQFLNMLAETQSRWATPGEALETVSRGLGAVPPDEPIARLRLLLTRGDILLRLSSAEGRTRDSGFVGEALATYRLVLKGARECDATTTVLRATTRLVRASAVAPGDEDSFAALKAAVSSFPEQVDCEDLREAKAVLEGQSI